MLPKLADLLMRNMMWNAQQKDEPAGRYRAGLSRGQGQLRERGEPERFTMPFSAYTEARMHPGASLAGTIVLAGLGVLASTMVSRLMSDEDD